MGTVIVNINKYSKGGTLFPFFFFFFVHHIETTPVYQSNFWINSVLLEHYLKITDLVPRRKWSHKKMPRIIH